MTDWQLSNGSLLLPLVWGSAPPLATVGAIADDVKAKYASLLKLEAQHQASATILDNDSIPSSAAMDPATRFTQAAARWRQAADDADSIAKLSNQYPSLQLEKGIAPENSASVRRDHYFANAAADDSRALGTSGVIPRNPAQDNQIADVAGGIGFSLFFVAVGYLGWLILARRHA